MKLVLYADCECILLSTFRTSFRFDLDCSLLRVVSIGVLSLPPSTGQNAKGTFGLGQKDRKLGH